MKTAILICLFSYFAYSIGSPIQIDVAAEEGNSTEFHQFLRRIELSLVHLDRVHRELVHLSHKAKNAEEYALLVEETNKRINETDSLIQEIVEEKNKDHTKFSEKWTLAELQLLVQKAKHNFELLKKSLEHHKPHNVEVADMSFEELKKFIEEKLSEGKKLLGDIQKLINDFKQKQTEELKQAAIKKIDQLKTKLISLEQQVDDALKKNQDSPIQKWLLEQAKSVLKGLETQLDSLEKQLKGPSVSVLDDSEFEKIKKDIEEKLKHAGEILKEVLDVLGKGNVTKELKEKLIKRIDELKPKLKDLEKKVDDELKKDNSGQIKKWLLEHAKKALEKLEEEVDKVEKKLKGETEFDLSILDDGTFEKLKKEIGDKLKEGKEILEQIHDIYNEYKNGKTKELKDKLVKKIDELKPKLEAIEKRIDDELKNNHPGTIKQWLLEHARDALKKLEEKVNDIEKKLKNEN